VRPSVKITVRVLVLLSNEASRRKVLFSDVVLMFFLVVMSVPFKAGTCLCGGSCRARTYNLRIKSPMHYQLC
jgi:hypothetical protein